MAHRLEFIGTQIGRMQRIFTDFLFDFSDFWFKKSEKIRRIRRISVPFNV